MWGASSEARKAAAADILGDHRTAPHGMPAAISARRSAGIDAIIRVSAFGEAALTVTPNRPCSLAR